MRETRQRAPVGRRSDERFEPSGDQKMPRPPPLAEEGGKKKGPKISATANSSLVTIKDCLTLQQRQLSFLHPLAQMRKVAGRHIAHGRLLISYPDFLIRRLLPSDLPL